MYDVIHMSNIFASFRFIHLDSNPIDKECMYHNVGRAANSNVHMAKTDAKFVKTDAPCYYIYIFIMLVLGKVMQ